MIRTKIQRTISTSTIKAYAAVVTDGEPAFEPLEPVVVTGTPTQIEAMKALQDAYGTKQFVITSIDTETALYEISVTDFVKHAKKTQQTKIEE